MSKKLFGKFFVFLLVVGLLFAAAPTKQAQAGAGTWGTPVSVGLNGRPSVLYDGTTYHMWYGGTTLSYATSTDGQTFVNSTVVTFDTPPAELESVTVIKEADGFKMIAYGSTVREFALYTSSDGTAWTKGATVFSGEGLPEGWVKVDAPVLLADAAEYKLYFQVRPADNTTYQIYLATSETINGTYALANGGAPVLTQGAAGDPDETRVMHPMVVKDSGIYYMWYTGYKAPTPFTTNYAYSQDGIYWIKGNNPVLTDTVQIAEPSVLKVGATWHLWAMFGTGSTSEIRHATAAETSPTKLNMSPALTTTTDTCADRYKVDVMVQAVEDLTGYHMEVTFDPSKIQVTSVVNGGFLNATGALLDPANSIDNTNGRVIFGLVQQGSGGDPVPVDGSGSLIKITFIPRVAGELILTIDGSNSTLVNWPEVQQIPFEVNGGATFNLLPTVKNVRTGVEYCHLQTAHNDTLEGDTLQLLADATLKQRLTTTKTLTIDTNGHNLTRTDLTPGSPPLILVDSGTLTITGNGTLTSSDTTGTKGYPVFVATMNNPSFILDGPTLSGGFSSLLLGTNDPAGKTTFIMRSGKLTDGMFVGGLAEVTINGGTITTQTGGYPPISNGSTDIGSDYMITINGGTVESAIGTAIDLAEDGDLVINGGTITGTTGVAMQSGNLTVTGTPSGTPSITGTAGDAIFLNGATSPTGSLTASISAGEITGTSGYALHETAAATSETTDITITGGKFTGTPKTTHGAVQFTTVDSAILKLTGGAYNTDPGGTPDYVYEPYDTYLNTDDGYYYIDTIISGTITAYTTPTLNATVTGNVVNFQGEVPWYPEDLDVGRTQGNRVGLYIHEPTGFDLSTATLTIGTQTWNWQDAKDNPTDTFVPVWKLITAVPQTFTMTVQWNAVSTQVFTVNVLEGSTLQLPPAPIIISTDIQGYYLTGDPQEFHVSLTNPDPGAIYNHVIFKVSVTADAGDLSLRYWDGSAFQTLSLTCDAGTCTTYYGPATGFPITPGYSATSLFELTAAVAGNYPFTITLEDLDTDPDTMLATYTNTGVVYPKPVISSPELAGPFQQGLEATVTINVDNVGLMNDPNSFSLHLNLPDGTVVVYGDNTYTCTAAGCDIPVTLAAGSNAIDLDITFDDPYIGPLGATLVDTVVEPDRNLATFATPTNVTVYGNVASVTGTVSMQARLTTAGVPVTLTGTVGFGPYTVTSVEGASGNLTFTNLAVGVYTITTNQPRYLNITAGMAKTIDISVDPEIATLRLRGGNAVWTDNKIDALDAGQVGTNWGGLGSTDLAINHGDVNFDNIVNIQDLALVGGNFDMASADAYGTWLLP